MHQMLLGGYLPLSALKGTYSAICTEKATEGKKKYILGIQF